jgi:pilus assembly protein Flp/PilA
MLRKCFAAVKNFVKAEDGPTAVEYAVMLALIVVVCIGAITSLGQSASKTFADVTLNDAASTT